MRKIEKETLGSVLGIVIALHNSIFLSFYGVTIVSFRYIKGNPPIYELIIAFAIAFVIPFGLIYQDIIKILLAVKSKPTMKYSIIGIVGYSINGLFFGIPIFSAIVTSSPRAN
jgi:hypothetical protein